MAIKEQLNTIKKNWLILLIAVILVMFIFGQDSLTNFSSGTETLSRYSPSMSYDTKGGRYASPAPSYAMESAQSFAQESAPIIERKITTTANINTKVKQGEFLQAEQRLKSIVTTTNSLLLQENVQKLGEEKKSYYHGNYVIKTESSKLDAIVAQLKDIGKVESSTQRKEDITESYKNLEIEINTEKERLARYKKILEEATLVEDKIKLNDHIFNQERTIKYLEDSLKNADKRVAYTTIYVDINEEQPAYADIKWVKGSELAVGLVNNTGAVIYLVVVLLPYAIATIIIWWAIRWIRNKPARKK